MPTETPPPPAVAPRRTPAPQAFSSFLPPEALAHLASATSTPPAALAQLTVSTTATDLWHAITAYLSYSPVPPGHPPVPLHVRRCRRDNDDDPAAANGAAMRGLSPRPAGLAGSMGAAAAAAAAAAAGKRSRRAQVPSKPVFELATATVDFVWPPPPHLTADALAALRDANPAASLHETLLLAGAGAKNNDDGVSRDTIHLFYYKVGDPAPVAARGAHDAMHEMLLVAEPGPLLVRFASEVIAWSQKVARAPDFRSRFPLYRFKLDRGFGHWHPEGLKRARPAESVVLADGQMAAILADVETFASDENRRWYFRHGLPYRRSFLFYGPPGTGKTSTVRVIASRFGLSCCALSVANRTFSNQSLGDALSSIPADALLVLEDVDALFNKDRSNKMETELTFSGLLNALDGLVSVEGLITIMTTNHIEQLEGALIRGGRVDRRFRFDLPDEPQLANLFASFYPDCDQKTKERFVNKVMTRKEGDEARAISTLQQLFIEMRGVDAEKCVAGIDEFFNKHFPAEKSNGPSYMI